MGNIKWLVYVDSPFTGRYNLRRYYWLPSNSGTVQFNRAVARLDAWLRKRGERLRAIGGPSRT